MSKDIMSRHEEQKISDKINVATKEKDLGHLDVSNVLRETSHTISNKYISPVGDNPFIVHKNHSTVPSYDNIIANQDNIDFAKKAKDLFDNPEVEIYNSNASKSYTFKTNNQFIQDQKVSRMVRHDKDIDNSQLSLNTQRISGSISSFMKQDDSTFNRLQPLNQINLEILAKNKNLFITIKKIEKGIETYSTLGIEENSEYRFTLVFIPGKDRMSAGHYMLEEDGRIVEIEQAEDNACAYLAINRATGMDFDEITQGSGLGIKEIPRDKFNKKEDPYEVEINDVELGIGGNPNFLFKNIIRKSVQLLKMVSNKQNISDCKSGEITNIKLSAVGQIELDQPYKIIPSEFDNVYVKFTVDMNLKERNELFKKQPLYNAFIEMSKVLYEYKKAFPHSNDIDISAISVYLTGVFNTFKDEKLVSVSGCKAYMSDTFKVFSGYLDSDKAGNMKYYFNPKIRLNSLNQIKGLDKLFEYAEKTGKVIKHIEQKDLIKQHIIDHNESVIERPESNMDFTIGFEQLMGDTTEYQE